ncbi:hypothetical protein BCR34DRAFT_578782 [Clohesyomyces aquaticus]|uniref:Uncharacterized protein n=1 Tax=Clohesyomyces aquaticus TaxID=1231657 RepID=A0A1Y1YEA7_9PLEO|nr:hypothetical protein BCR34DRAFT_578782 [Clohesyomyces aquaticus]
MILVLGAFFPVPAIGPHCILFRAAKTPIIHFYTTIYLHYHFLHLPHPYTFHFFFRLLQTTNHESFFMHLYS